MKHNVMGFDLTELQGLGPLGGSSLWQFHIFHIAASRDCSGGIIRIVVIEFN